MVAEKNDISSFCRHREEASGKFRLPNPSSDNRWATGMNELGSRFGAALKKL